MLKSAILALALLAQECDGKLAVELKDLPGDAKKPPTLLCEGTTDLPDGAILKVRLHFGPAQPGYESAPSLVQAKDGKFSKDFQIFGPRARNLAGTYIVRVAFDPNFQPDKLKGLPPRNAEGKLEVGDALDQEREQTAIRKQLADEIRAIQAVADEIQAKLAEAKGRPEPQAWAALREGWRTRLIAIERRAGLVPEYGFLGLLPIVDAGLEQLRENVLTLADCAGKGLAAPLKEGRIVFDRTAQTFVGELTASSLTPRQLRALVESARSILKESPALPGDALPAARNKLVAITFTLGKQLGEKHQDLVGALADGVKRLFDALHEKRADDAKSVQAELLQKTEKLLEALQDPK